MKLRPRAVAICTKSQQKESGAPGFSVLCNIHVPTISAGYSEMLMTESFCMCMSTEPILYNAGYMPKFYYCSRHSFVITLLTLGINFVRNTYLVTSSFSILFLLNFRSLLNTLLSFVQLFNHCTPNNSYGCNLNEGMNVY